MKSEQLKKGSLYTRKEIGLIYLPETGRPKGGNWDTGYVRPEGTDDLIIFMTIGMPGRSNLDYGDRYDESTETVTWYGKPRSHSGQPTFQKIFSGELKPHFFARWDDGDPFTYLGEGKVIGYEDGHTYKNKTGKVYTTIQLKINLRDAGEILLAQLVEKESSIESSFALEKHLEDFIIKNWSSTELSQEYDLYEKDGNKQQIRTDTGPLDILAISKDKKEYLVIELKRDRASDVVVGQTQRYMGWVIRELAKNGERVKGCIIGLNDDLSLRNALLAAPNIKFLKYRLKFDLISSE